MADSAINNNVNGIESPEKIVKCNQIRVVCAENGEIRRTLVQTAYSHYPVRIIPVESWKLHVTVNILGFGGGIISGDRVMFDIKVENAATLLLRTQGNTKVFKAVEDSFCNQSMTLEVHDDALLVFAPDFTSCFEGADFRQQTQLKCSKSGSMIFMDWYSSGRQGRDQLWSAKKIQTILSFLVDDNCLLFDNQMISGSEHGSFSQKVGRSEIFGSLLLHGPKMHTISTHLACFQERQTFEQHQLMLQHRQKHSNAKDKNTFGNRSLVSVTSLGDNSVVVRFIFSNAIYAYEFMHELFLPLASCLDGTVPYHDRVSNATTFADEADPQCALSKLRAFKAGFMEC